MYTIRDRVGASRTDANGMMKLTGAMDAIQDCSLLWMESEPCIQDFFAGNNLGLCVMSRQVDVLRLPAYGEEIAVETRVFACQSFLEYRNTVLYGEDGLPCLLTWSLGAYVNLGTGRMARLPESIIDKVSIDDKFDMEYLDRRIDLPDMPGRCLEPVAVKRHDIDLYRHMNNVRYVEVALELLPENFMIKRLRIEYKKSAKLGDLLYPRILEAPSSNQYILLLDAHDAPFAVMDFSQAIPTNINEGGARIDMRQSRADDLCLR